jgi:hypothetical protein
MSVVNLFIPSLNQFAMLLAIMGVGAAISIVGAALSGRHRMPEMNVIFGWAFVTVIFTVTGALFRWPLQVAGWLFLAALVISLWVVVKRRLPLLPKGIARTALLGLPMILVVSAMYPSQWDEFAHWIPAAHYLFVWDSFPNADLPRSGASLPGYPYAMGFPVYLISHVAGRFIENATAVLNVLMMLAFAHMVARIIVAQGQSNSKLIADVPPSWWACATGILAVTILNPTFVQKLVLTAYGELPSGLTLALGIIIAWHMFKGLAEGDRKEARHQAWLLSLVLLLLISLKQSTLALFLILMFVVSVVALRDPKIKLRDYASLLPLLILPAIAIYVIWGHYVATYLVNSSHSIRPFDKWFWDILFDIIGQIFYVVSRKGGYFAPALFVSGLAIYALYRWRGSRDRMFLMAGLAFLTYNFFLLVTYLSVFGRFDALRVVSFWRYNTHLGLILVVAFILVLGLLYRRYLAKRAWNRQWAICLPIILVLGLQVGLIHKLRFDVRATKIHIREIAPEIVSRLPKGASLMVVDPESDGAYGTQMRYHMYMAGRKFAGNISTYSSRTKKHIDLVINMAKPHLIWVHSITPSVLQALSPDLKKGASYLMERDGSGWKIVKSWPFKGYSSPNEIKD